MLATYDKQYPSNLTRTVFDLGLWTTRLLVDYQVGCSPAWDHLNFSPVSVDPRDIALNLLAVPREPSCSRGVERFETIARPCASMGILWSQCNLSIRTIIVACRHEDPKMQRLQHTTEMTVVPDAAASHWTQDVQMIDICRS